MATTKNPDGAKSIIINSVDRSIDILEYLYKAGKDTSISQISKDLDIYKSTVFRTLATLESRGYVMQNKTTELYSVGPKLYAYSGAKHDSVIVQSVRPYLAKLSDKYKDTVTYATLILDHSNMYSIDTITSLESQHSLGMIRRLAHQDECYCASIGKCMLAFGENIHLEVYEKAELTKFTENTITSYKDLVSEIETIRKQGYAVDDEEREIGLFCLGVPVLNNRGYAVAAFSLSGPMSRIKDEHFEEKIAYMKELSKEISAALYL